MIRRSSTGVFVAANVCLVACRAPPASVIDDLKLLSDIKRWVIAHYLRYCQWWSKLTSQYCSRWTPLQARWDNGGPACPHSELSCFERYEPHFPFPCLSTCCVSSHLDAHGLVIVLISGALYMFTAETTQWIRHMTTALPMLEDLIACLDITHGSSEDISFPGDGGRPSLVLGPLYWEDDDASGSRLADRTLVRLFDQTAPVLLLILVNVSRPLAPPILVCAHCPHALVPPQ